MQASLKLNEQVNFLTASVYRQIRSLEIQGKTTEAANVAQNAYADAIQQRTPTIMQNLGYMERAWNGIKDAVKGAADATLNIGRTNTLEQQVAQIATLVKQRDKILAGGPSVTNQLDAGRLNERIAKLQAELKLTTDIEDKAKATAKADADQQDQVQAMAEFDKAGVQFLEKRVQMERAITAARELGQKAGYSDEVIQKRVADIRKSFAVDSKSNAAQQYYESLVASSATAIAKIDAQEKAELADNAKRMADDTSNAGVYAAAKGEIIKKYARERALFEEQQIEASANAQIEVTTGVEAKIEAIRAEANRKADADEGLKVITHQQALDAKKVADQKAAKELAALSERSLETQAQTEIAATVDELRKIDLIRQEAIRKANADLKADAITQAQAQANIEAAGIQARLAIRAKMEAANPVVQLELEYQQKLAIVKLYEAEMAQAGMSNATAVTEKRKELDFQYQQQKQKLAEQEFASQSVFNGALISSLNTLQSTGTSAITGILTGTMSLKQAVSSLSNSILNEAVGALVQMGVQYLKNAVISQTADEAIAAAHLASMAVNSAAYTASVTAQVGVMSALAAQNAFAATAAIPIVGPVLAPAAGAAAGLAAGAIGAAAIAGAPLAGARRYGGPTGGGQLYRVNETGAPEMFTGANGNQYMLGAQSGHVTAADQLTNSGNTTVQVFQNAERNSASSSTAADGSKLIKIFLAAVADDMASGGVTARATKSRFNL